MKTRLILFCALPILVSGCYYEEHIYCPSLSDQPDVWCCYHDAKTQTFVNQHGDSLKMDVEEDEDRGGGEWCPGEESCESYRSYHLTNYFKDYSFDLIYEHFENPEINSSISNLTWRLNETKFTTWPSKYRYGRHHGNDERAVNFKNFYKEMDVMGINCKSVAEWKRIPNSNSRFTDVLFNWDMGLLCFTDIKTGEIWRRCP